ncbi:MAG: 50S ribosomal protein L21e [Crenarchaeota archaeon]|nr:50S ribosomal protein L21e [Thermoproteota archaeon]
MVKRTHGYRFKCRKLLSKSPREKGRPGLIRWLYRYDIGEKVVIDIDPTYVTTAPHRRYQGKVGTIIGKRGRAYVIEIYLGDKRKIVVTTPDHIKPLNEREKMLKVVEELGIKASPDIAEKLVEKSLGKAQ